MKTHFVLPFRVSVLGWESEYRATGRAAPVAEFVFAVTPERSTMSKVSISVCALALSLLLGGCNKETPA
ncbi:MAG: hypothetical protein WBV87_11500, partial [Candidatus Acidiferrales bacterium]